MAVGRLDCRDVHYQRGCFQYYHWSHNMRIPEKPESFALRVLVVTLLVVQLDALNEEGQCLLEFKRNLHDQFGKLKTWMSTDENPKSFSAACKFFLFPHSFNMSTLKSISTTVFVLCLSC